MTNYLESFQLVSSGINHPSQTFETFSSLTKAFLIKLREVDDSFSNLSILGCDDFDPLAFDLSDLEMKISASIKGTRLANTVLSPSSIVPNGLSIVLHSDYGDGGRKHMAVSQGGVEIAIDAVSNNGNGGVTLTLPRAGTTMSEPHQAKRMLRIMLESWPFRFASARTIDYQKAVAEAGDVCSGQWMLFLPFRDLDQWLPSEIESERTHGGTLVSVMTRIPRADVQADVLSGKRARTALDMLGLVWHSQYAIHGWPPDEEEWRYEEFISGAPRGRKYRVRCIDFDGYDSQRNVLLYAKLFRQLRTQRKEWGLRGWDGPVLNEAKRQVRAANGAQIEWHVGLEEPAARVRTLLADYTDFTEQQLRVIYTPVSQMSGT